MNKFKDIIIHPDNTIKYAMRLMNNNGLGGLIVVNKSNTILGVLTDGNIRRAIFAGKEISQNIKKIYSKKIVKFEKDNLSKINLEKISLEKNISIIPIANKNKLIDYYSIKKKQKKNDIHTVVMAGGLGARMKPFTNIFPKPMMPIGDKTMIQMVLEKFIANGLTNFFFTINYKSDLLIPYLKNLKKILKIKFQLIKEKNRLGTAGSLKFLRGKIKKDFFLTNCDSCMNVNLNEVYNFHLKNKNDITIIASVKNIIIPYGVLQTNKKQKFSKIHEKPKHTYIVNTGVYVLSPRVLSLIPKKDDIFDMNMMITKCKNKKKKIKVYLIDDDQWQDFGQINNFKI